MLPTLASLAGAPDEARNPQWRGIDYAGHVLGTASGPTQDRIVFTYDDFQAGQKNGPYVRQPNHIVSVREKRWKPAKYYDPSGKEPDQWEMYDRKHDPLERHNLAHKPAWMTKAQRAQFKRLKKKLAEIEKTTLAPL